MDVYEKVRPFLTNNLFFSPSGNIHPGWVGLLELPPERRDKHTRIGINSAPDFAGPRLGSTTFRFDHI